MMPTPQNEPEPQVLLSSYPRYPDAQAAVDTLSDAGFPVQRVTIVWSRLRQIEHVTGRRTVLSAGLDGLFKGAWLGLLLGVLLVLFVELDEDTTAFAAIVSYVATGAVVGAAFMAISHWSKRGRRDFSTTGRLDAEAYEVWVDPEVVDQARQLLNVRAS